MKKVFLLCLAALALNAGLQAQMLVGIRFFDGTFEQALEQARKEDKLVFLDAYATWCGPCKAMSRNVFPQKEVGDFYNANFVNLKVDWEASQASALRSRYSVRAFPTLMYLDAGGKRIGMVEGYHGVQDMIKVGETVLERAGKQRK